MNTVIMDAEDFTKFMKTQVFFKIISISSSKVAVLSCGHTTDFSKTRVKPLVGERVACKICNTQKVSKNSEVK